MVPTAWGTNGLGWRGSSLGPGVGRWRLGPTAPRSPEQVRRHILAAAFVVMLAAALEACGGSSERAERKGAQEPRAGTSAPAGGEARPVPDALQFTATALDGSRVAGADYAGRDVVLWFWAPW